MDIIALPPSDVGRVPASLSLPGQVGRDGRLPCLKTGLESIVFHPELNLVWEVREN